MLQKLRCLESILQPINRLPKDTLTLIPRFFTNEEWAHDTFPMNKPLITMTHVCRSWRNTLLSTPSLWTQIDFSTSNSKQAKGFLGRSGKQLLDVYQFFESEDDVEPFLSTTLRNMYRLRRLDIASFLLYLEPVLTRFTGPAPELTHLRIANEPDTTDRDMKLPSTIFKVQLPKLESLSLAYVHSNLRGFNFPSLTWFDFTTGTSISVRDLTSFFERCPSLESIEINLSYAPQPPIPPPHKRVRLAALKKLKLDQTASTSGLLDHLILPNYVEVMLRGQFTGEKFDCRGGPAAQIHPSSVNHISAMKGITKAAAMPNSCIFSGPNGYLRFWCFQENRKSFDAEFFTSFSPISVSEIRELLVGTNAESYFGARRKPWTPDAARVRGAFTVLKKVEDLTILGCKTAPFFVTLGATVDNRLLLPGLRRLTIYVGYGDLDLPALIRCAKARLERSRQLGEVTIVFKEDPGADVMQEVESLRELVGELNCRIGATPEVEWEKWRW